MNDMVTVEKIKRNAYGQNTENLNMTLPHSTIVMVMQWSRENNTNMSRAINELLWLGYAKYREDLEEHDR